MSELIKMLVQDEGLTKTQEIAREIDYLRRKTDCPETNRRYHPTDKDIRNHVYNALHCNRFVE